MQNTFLLCSLIAAMGCSSTKPALGTPTAVPDVEPLELWRNIRPFLGGNELLERHTRALIYDLDLKVFGGQTIHRTFDVESLIQAPRNMAYEACHGAINSHRSRCINGFVEKIRGIACNEMLLRAADTVVQKSTRLREATLPVIQPTVALASAMRNIWPQISGRVDDSQDCDPQTGICTLYKGYRKMLTLPAFAPFRTEDELDWDRPDSSGNPTPSGNKVLPFPSKHIAAFLYRRAMQCGPHVLDLYIEIGHGITSASH